MRLPASLSPCVSLISCKNITERFKWLSASARIILMDCCGCSMLFAGDTISETGSTTTATNVQSPPPSSASSSSNRRRIVRQATEKRHDQQMFTPCIAFRVAGTPMKYVASKLILSIGIIYLLRDWNGMEANDIPSEPSCIRRTREFGRLTHRRRGPNIIIYGSDTLVGG